MMEPALSAEHGIASVDNGKPTPYDGGYYGGKVATGEKFNPYAMTAAHRTLPLGTVVQVDYPKGKVAYLRINDRGPCLSAYCQKIKPDLLNRIIDLTPQAADSIGLPGLGRVTLRTCKTYRVAINPKELIPLRTCS